MERLQELFLLIAASLSGVFGMLVQQVTYAAQPDAPAVPHASVMFVGDLMFDRSIRTAMESYGSDFVFSCIQTELAAPDLVVGNLEGPITEQRSRSVGSAVGSRDNFVFTFPTYVAPLLKRHNIAAVALGNNHILNFGMEGLATTTRELRKAGVGYFGEPGGASTLDIERGGIELTLIGYNEFDPQWNASITISQVKEARDRGRQPVVFAHWGNEYQAATERQKDLARRFVDAGAVLVVGAHPHVIQEYETYRGAPIYYSLGNFIFDQYWNESVRTGEMLTVDFGPAGVESVRTRLVHLEQDRRTCLRKSD